MFFRILTTDTRRRNLHNTNLLIEESLEFTNVQSRSGEESEGKDDRGTKILFSRNRSLR
jgi:hypothetical protein